MPVRTTRHTSETRRPSAVRPTAHSAGLGLDDGVLQLAVSNNAALLPRPSPPLRSPRPQPTPGAHISIPRPKLTSSAHRIPPTAFRKCVLANSIALRVAFRDHPPANSIPQRVVPHPGIQPHPRTLAPGKGRTPMRHTLLRNRTRAPANPVPPRRRGQSAKRSGARGAQCRAPSGRRGRAVQPSHDATGHEQKLDDKS